MIARTRFKRKGMLCLIATVALLLVFSGVGFAWDAPKVEKPQHHKDFPKRPIDFICGWGVGGGADTMSRELGQLAKKYYGITFVVSNMPGAAGVKGIDYAMRQPADGYTVFFAAWDAYMNFLLKKSKWGPHQIELILRGMYVPGAYWVRKDSPFKTWKQVIAYSKKHPYKLKLADVGHGGLGDLTLGLWEQCSGLKLTYVPYDKPALRYAAFAGGHTDLLYEQPGDIQNLIHQGARPLVFMSEKRLPAFPNTPTAKELGCDITIALWRGVGIAKAVPEDIRNYLTNVLCGVTQSPEYQQFLKNTVSSPNSVLCGAAAEKMYVNEYEMVKKLMKK